MIDHVSKNKRIIFISQLVDKESEQTHALNMTELFVELGCEVSDVNKPLGHVLILIKRRVCCIGQMLDDHESHLIKSKILAKADCLNLSLDLILIGFGLSYHLVKGKDGVAICDLGELLALGARIACFYKAPRPLRVLLMHVDLFGNQARLAQVAHFKHVRVTDVPLVEVSMLENGPNHVLNRKVGRYEGMCRHEDF